MIINSPSAKTYSLTALASENTATELASKLKQLAQTNPELAVKISDRASQLTKRGLTARDVGTQLATEFKRGPVQDPLNDLSPTARPVRPVGSTNLSPTARPVTGNGPTTLSPTARPVLTPSLDLDLSPLANGGHGPVPAQKVPTPSPAAAPVLNPSVAAKISADAGVDVYAA